MKLKVDGDGHAVLIDGKPVYVSDDGKEVAFDAPATVATISRLNAEAKSHRERAEAAEKSLGAFSGLDDPAAARKALETVAALDQKKLIDAGEVERVRAEIAKGFEAKLSEERAAREAAESQLYSEKIGGNFARSKLIADRLAIPSDLVQARFGSAFKVENGEVIAYDAQGQKIYSRARPGELATFDEALEVLVDAYPNRDAILRSSGASGGGAPGGKPNGGKPVYDPSKLGGSKAERAEALRAKFPDLQ